MQRSVNILLGSGHPSPPDVIDTLALNYKCRLSRARSASHVGIKKVFTQRWMEETLHRFRATLLLTFPPPPALTLEIDGLTKDA